MVKLLLTLGPAVDVIIWAHLAAVFEGCHCLHARRCCGHCSLAGRSTAIGSSSQDYDVLLRCCVCSGEQPVDLQYIIWHYAQPPPLAAIANASDSTQQALQVNTWPMCVCMLQSVPLAILGEAWAQVFILQFWYNQYVFYPS